MSYAYQNSLAKYDSLVNAYKTAKQNKLSKEELDNINEQVKEQTKQALGLGAGLPISMTVATSFLKTKGSKALLKGLGKKLGMNDEDIETLLTKDPKEAMANLVEKYGSRKINKLLGKKTAEKLLGKKATEEEPAEEEPVEEEADEADVADEPLDTEAFNVQFQTMGEVQTTRTFEGGISNLVESSFTPREPVDADEFYDAQEQLGGQVEEAVTQPEEIEMTPLSSTAETTAGETATAVATAGEVGEDTALAGEVLDATPLAPLGVILGLAGIISSFIPFMSHHHHHTPPPPPPPPNLSHPSFQAGI